MRYLITGSRATIKEELVREALAELNDKDTVSITGSSPAEDIAARLTTLRCVQENLGLFHCPWLVGGDFNALPTEIMEQEWGPMAYGHIVAPPVTQTVLRPNGRVVDWGLCDHKMHGLIASISTDRTSPCQDHVAIVYKINARPRLVMIPTLLKPKKR